MKARRRLMFQLTPLLDLLLIVIFAQYMEVQQTAETGEQELREREAEMTQRLNKQQATMLADIELARQNWKRGCKIARENSANARQPSANTTTTSLNSISARELFWPNN